MHVCTKNHVEPFTMALNYKQFKCSSTQDWINNLCYICTLEYCTAKQKKKKKTKKRKPPPTIKNQNTTTCNNSSKSYRESEEPKKPDRKEYILYDLIIREVQEQAKTNACSRKSE